MTATDDKLIGKTESSLYTSVEVWKTSSSHLLKMNILKPQKRSNPMRSCDAAGRMQASCVIPLPQVESCTTTGKSKLQAFGWRSSQPSKAPRTKNCLHQGRVKNGYTWSQHLISKLSKQSSKGLSKRLWSLAKVRESCLGDSHWFWWLRQTILVCG